MKLSTNRYFIVCGSINGTRMAYRKADGWTIKSAVMDFMRINNLVMGVIE